jgi:UDP-glucose 4-epimerase
MKTLVTGGAGFIGSHLVERLLLANRQIIILDDFSGGNKNNLELAQLNGSVEIVSGSVLDQDLVSKLMERSDQCYHLAASLGVSKINSEPFSSFNTNFFGSEIVFSQANKRKVRTIFASSSEVYGKNPNMPLAENSDRVLGSTKIPRWSYSEAKALDELYAFELNKKENFPVTIARFFNTVGPRQNSSYGMVLPKFVKSAILNQPLVVFGDGLQTRSFCSVTDAVLAIELLMNSTSTIGQVFNVGSPVEISILDLATKVINLTNSNSKIVFKEYSDEFGNDFEEPLRRVPDISKIKESVAWKPTISLDNIIIEIIEYIKANEI